MQVIYTTVFLGDDSILYMLRNFVAWLQKPSLLRHTMLITQDERSWKVLLDEGLPCFLDQVTPGKEQFADEHARYAQR